MQKEFLEQLRVGEQPLSQEVMEAILAQHDRELAQVTLENAVQMAVAKAGGRSVKAITALLDMEAIAASEDVPGALDTALATLKKDSGYLFEAPTPPPYARFTGTVQQGSEVPATLAGALRQRMNRN